MTYLGDAQAEGAIFLPAIQPTYAKVPFRNQKSIAGRPWPEKLRLKDLDFLNPSSRLFSIKYALASAGLFAKERGANMVTKRDREKTVIIGDSGGYQIIGGALDHRKADVRNKMLRWLEDNCDWSMTLDVPTKGIKNGTSGYENFGECLSDTRSYLDFFADP